MGVEWGLHTLGSLDLHPTFFYLRYGVRDVMGRQGRYGGYTGQEDGVVYQRGLHTCGSLDLHPTFDLGTVGRVVMGRYGVGCREWCRGVEGVTLDIHSCFYLGGRDKVGCWCKWGHKGCIQVAHQICTPLFNKQIQDCKLPLSTSLP